MEIESLSEAGNYVERILHRRGENIVRVVPVNKSRHAIIQTDLSVYYLLYKRDTFHSYGQFFGEGGHGDSINVEFLDAILKSEKLNLILITYKSGHIYSIDKEEWRKHTRENGTIRTQYLGEVTSSIPLHLLQRWDIIAQNTEIKKWTQNKESETLPVETTPQASQSMQSLWQRLKAYAEHAWTWLRHKVRYPGK